MRGRGKARVGKEALKIKKNVMPGLPKHLAHAARVFPKGGERDASASSA
jgi:hypothetical protein